MRSLRTLLMSASLALVLITSAFASATPTTINGIDPGGGSYNMPTIFNLGGGYGPMQVMTEGQKATYTASVTGFSPVASATDILNIFGSSSKTIRITRIEISGTTSAATAAVNDLQVIKRSTAGTLGSAVLTALTAVPHDSASAAASATISTVGTANYTTLGTSVGILQARKFTCQLATATATDFPIVPPTIWSFTERSEQGIVLRGATQQLALNWNGGAVPAGCSLDISVTWTEE